jgi:hypothetical protein
MTSFPIWQTVYKDTANDDNSASLKGLMYKQQRSEKDTSSYIFVLFYEDRDCRISLSLFFLFD